MRPTWLLMGNDCPWVDSAFNLGVVSDIDVDFPVVCCKFNDEVYFLGLWRSGCAWWPLGDEASLRHTEVANVDQALQWVIQDRCLPVLQVS